MSSAVVAPPSSVSTPLAPSRRICVLTEDLSGSPDEGIKKFALRIAHALRAHHRVTLLGTRGTSSLPHALVIPTGRTFVGRGLMAALRRERPDVIFYVATASTSLWAFARSQVLKRYVPSAKVVLVGLQDSRHAAWQQHLLGRLAPDLVCVQSPQNQTYLEDRGCRVVQVPSGVDLTTFQPVPPERSGALRDQYGLPADRPIVLHVGHLQRHRGVGVLAQLAAQWPGQVVLVASSSTRQEADLADELRSAGVAVFADFQPHVEHFYQLADAYLFPVQSSMNSIAVPLSVLEALACNLPVATTRFGGLTSILGTTQRPGLRFADDADELIAHAQSLAEQPGLTTRSLVEPFSWEAIADTLLSASTGGTPTTAAHAAPFTTQAVAAAPHGVDEMTSTVPMHR